MPTLRITSKIASSDFNDYNVIIMLNELVGNPSPLNVIFGDNSSDIEVHLATNANGDIISTLGDVLGIINNTPGLQEDLIASAHLNEGEEGTIAEDYEFANAVNSLPITIVLQNGTDEPTVPNVVDGTLYIDTDSGVLYYYYGEEWFETATFSEALAAGDPNQIQFNSNGVLAGIPLSSVEPNKIDLVVAGVDPDSIKLTLSGVEAGNPRAALEADNGANFSFSALGGISSYFPGPDGEESSISLGPGGGSFSAMGTNYENRIDLTPTRVFIRGENITLEGVPVYADNAAALTGGLLEGDLYRTAIGEVRIVYTP